MLLITILFHNKLMLLLTLLLHQSSISFVVLSALLSAHAAAVDYNLNDDDVVVVAGHTDTQWSEKPLP